MFELMSAMFGLHFFREGYGGPQFFIYAQLKFSFLGFLHDRNISSEIAITITRILLDYNNLRALVKCDPSTFWWSCGFSSQKLSLQVCPKKSKIIVPTNPVVYLVGMHYEGPK